jgi:C-terminal peptidase prc
VTIVVESRVTGEKREHTVDRVRVGTTSIHGVGIVDEETGAGLVRLDSFQNNSVDDFDAAIVRLLDLGMESLILDLRDNTGGVLRVAVELADRFLEVGAVITSTRGRAPGADRSYTSERPSLVPADLPVVLLVDGTSASASEILAGALADHGRAVLVGTTTFGKGVVQSVIPLGGGDVILKITSGRYYTPAGRCIHKRIGDDGREVADSGGIPPDVYLPVSNEERLLLRLTRDLERIEDNKAPGTEIFAPEDLENGIAALRERVGGFHDIQLEAALDVLRGRTVLSRFAKEEAVPAGPNGEETAEDPEEDPK